MNTDSYLQATHKTAIAARKNKHSCLQISPELSANKLDLPLFFVSRSFLAAPCDSSACKNLACALGTACLLGLSPAQTFTSMCLMKCVSYARTTRSRTTRTRNTTSRFVDNILPTADTEIHQPSLGFRDQPSTTKARKVGDVFALKELLGWHWSHDGATLATTGLWLHHR